MHSFAYVLLICHYILFFYALYEKCFESSELYLIAFSSDYFERHAMYHSRELYFALKMMLMYPCCIGSFSYISPTPYHWPVFML